MALEDHLVASQHSIVFVPFQHLVVCSLLPRDTRPAGPLVDSVPLEVLASVGVWALFALQSSRDLFLRARPQIQCSQHESNTPSSEGIVPCVILMDSKGSFLSDRILTLGSVTLVSCTLNLQDQPKMPVILVPPVCLFLLVSW